MKQKVFWFIITLVLVLFALLLFVQADAGSAQAPLITPTSPDLCFPITPMDAWRCLNGTAVPIEQLPTSTQAPTGTPGPTATIQPYPAPPGAAESPFYKLWLTLIGVW